MVVVDIISGIVRRQISDSTVRHMIRGIIQAPRKNTLEGQTSATDTNTCSWLQVTALCIIIPEKQASKQEQEKRKSVRGYIPLPYLLRHILKVTALLGRNFHLRVAELVPISSRAK